MDQDINVILNSSQAKVVRAALSARIEESAKLMTKCMKNGHMDAAQEIKHDISNLEEIKDMFLYQNMEQGE